MKPISLRDRSRRTAALLMLVVWCNSLLLSPLAISAPIPANKPAHYPAWWFSQDVVPRTDVNKSAPSWPGDYRQADDYAAINRGQLKNLALAAADEFDSRLIGGAGSGLKQLLSTWLQTNGVGDFLLDGQGKRIPKTNSTTNDFAAVNLGQLKNVAKVFYDRLIALHYVRAYPWQSSQFPPDDHALANRGQAKNLFAFDVAKDTDGDGLPDMWELANGLNPADPSDVSGDVDGDKLSNLDEFQSGKDAQDYYNGQIPTLTVEGGDQQQGPPDRFLANPLVVKVTAADGTLLVNAPVTFTVTAGDGFVAPEANPPRSISLVQRSGVLGQVGVVFCTGTNGGSSTVTASVSTAGQTVSVPFNVTTLAAPSAPEDFDYTDGQDGNTLLHWSDTSANETGFTIESSFDNGETWQTVTNVGANTTTATVSTPEPPPGVQPVVVAYRISAANANGQSTYKFNQAFGQQDNDGDGLLNQEEIYEGTLINNPNTDGDSAVDGADVSPLDPDLDQPRVRVSQYAVLDLTKTGLNAEDWVDELNDRGQMIGEGGYAQGFFWENGQRRTPLAFPVGLNNNGVVIGSTMESDHNSKSAKWVSSTGSLTYFSAHVPSEISVNYAPIGADDNGNYVPGLGVTVAGIDDSGTVVGKSSLAWVSGETDLGLYLSLGTRWNGSSSEQIGDYRESIEKCELSAITANGSIVGGVRAASPDFYDALYWNGAINRLPRDPGSDGGWCWDSNKFGLLIGSEGYSSSYYYWDFPVIWVPIPGGWKSKYLGPYNPVTGRNSVVNGSVGGFNDRVEATGWFHDAGNNTIGHLWQNGKIVNLNNHLLPTGWRVAYSTALNNHGVIAARANPVGSRGEDLGQERPVLLFPVEMQEVSFGGTKYHRVESDDGLTTYIAPQWVDQNGDGNAANEAIGEYNDPVAFTRNTKPMIGAKLKVAGLQNGMSVKVRATGPGSVQIPATTPALSGEEITLPLTESTGTLVNTIKYYTHKDRAKAFELRWELSLDGGSTWSQVATTKHTVYVTLDDPAPMRDFKGDSVKLRQETLFEIGCRNADGETDVAIATEKIWGEFTDRKVVRVLDGRQLTYYKVYNPLDSSGKSVTTAAQLLAATDGQCGSWADLFIRIRQVQGIEDPDEYVYFGPRFSGEGFAVKNWTFRGDGTSGDAIYPYLNICPLGHAKLEDAVSAVYGAASYNWAYTEVSDTSGIPGQGTENPASLFGNHQVVIGGVYYDPSYGLKHNRLDDIDSNAVDGFFIITVRNLDEATYNLDLNSDGDKVDTAVPTAVFLFRKNPPGSDLTILRIEDR